VTTFEDGVDVIPEVVPVTEPAPVVPAEPEEVLVRTTRDEDEGFPWLTTVLVFIVIFCAMMVLFVALCYCFRGGLQG
jgi:hypothetical protein